MADHTVSKVPIQLPVIDISKVTPASGRAMIDAATEYGFLYVDSESTDFSTEDVEKAFQLVGSHLANSFYFPFTSFSCPSAFFALPQVRPWLIRNPLYCLLFLLFLLFSRRWRGVLVDIWR